MMVGPSGRIGATGTVGSALVDQLAAAGVRVRALVRDARRAGDRLPAAVELVQGDLARPDTLAAVFAGMERVFLATSDPLLEPAAVAAAAAAGARLVVKVSALGPGRQPPPGHAQAERALQASGLDWVLLRPSAFMQTLAMYLPGLIGPDGTFALPAGAGRTGWIDARDIAAAAAAVLVDPAPATGRVYTLTGPAALSMDDVAADLTSTLGRAIRYRPIDPDDAPAGLAARGLPADMAGFLAAHYRSVSRGDFDLVTDDVRALAGRPPRTWSDFVSEHPEHFPQGQG